MSKLPDLEAWAIFAKIAEAGSFARTAEELEISQATVSKAISRLEKRMGTVLLHRTSRRVSLTESGLAVLEKADRLLREGIAAEEELADQSVTLRGPIRMSAPMSFGLPHLAPAFPEFMRRHPEVSLTVDFHDMLLDLVAHRFDVALRISSMEDSSFLARRLCDVRVLLVGSPAYFEKHGRPQHPGDLARHHALRYAYSRSRGGWKFHHALDGEFSQPVSGPLHMNNAEAIMPALMAGLGLALQPEFLVWNELRTGALETVMEDWHAEAITIHLLTPPGRTRPARVQALVNYLCEHFANVPWAWHAPPR